jgi:L-threonylcarbamoyladenylate synthase
MRMRLLPGDDEAVQKVAEIVKWGGLIVYPTDTLYGIGCDPLNLSALERINRLKGREGKPLPVLVSSIEAARKLVVVDSAPQLLMEAFWPVP